MAAEGEKRDSAGRKMRELIKMEVHVYSDMHRAAIQKADWAM